MAQTQWPPAPAISRLHAQVPITALAIHDGHLLAAQDTSLCVYDIDSGALIQQRSPAAFASLNAGQPIHGIHVNPISGAILLWGASAVAYLPGGWEDETEVSGKANDWVYAGALSTCRDGRGNGFGVVVTAHNDLVPVTLDDASGTLVFGKPVSPSRPILYSATLSFLSATELLIVGGTVFGEIIVWRCHFDSSTRTGTGAEVLYTLTGHEGSIFGVAISPPLGPGRRRLLASCSDDRTIRLWDITEGKACESAAHERDSRAARETGFITAPPTESKPLATAMGHSSRIWGVRIVAAEEEDSPTILGVYSFGEDATMQRWGVDIDAGRLTHEKTYSLNDGKHLWAHALATRADGILLFATGGADSRISLIREPSLAASPGPPDLTSIDVRDIVRNAPALPSGSKRAKEIITRYDFLSADELVAMTSSGRILRGAVGAPASEWRIVPIEDGKHAEDLGLCYALRSVAPGLVALGTTSGNIYLYGKDSGLSLVASLDGRIMDLIPVEGSSLPTGAVDVYVQLQGNKPPYYLTIDAFAGTLTSRSPLTDLDDRFVAVSALRARDYIFIGSRHGYLSVLRAQAHESGTSYVAIYTLPPRSPDAISCILEIPSVNALSAPLYVLTTSRDGHYRIYRLQAPQAPSTSIALDLVHEVPAPLGPVLTGAYFTTTTTASSPDLILHGFKGKDFLIYNATTRTDIASIPCGGAHRMHSLYADPSAPERLRFAFTRTSLVSVYTQDAVSHRILAPGTHGREIRALSSNGTHLATGSEDTTIRIWSTGAEEPSSSRPEHLMTMKAHNTGIQQLRWLGSSHLLSSGGFEEFFVWRVRHLEGSLYTGVAVVREARLEDTTGDTDGDLRIMDFDACWASGNDDSDDSSSSRGDQDRSMIITMVLSDSTLKTYTYSRGGGFVPRARGRYTGACVTQVRRLTDSRGGSKALVTGSTDGHICIWTEDLGTETCQLSASMRVHQNAIKAMDMVPHAAGFLVLTGGDDNAVHLSRVASAPAGSPPGERIHALSKLASFPRAHTASINGVAIVRRSCGGGLLGVSCSNDQRVKLWDLGHSGQEVALIDDRYSGVADPGDLEVLDEGQGTLAIGGVGMELWHVTGRIPA